LEFPVVARWIPGGDWFRHLPICPDGTTFQSWRSFRKNWVYLISYFLKSPLFPMVFRFWDMPSAPIPHHFLDHTTYAISCDASNLRMTLAVASSVTGTYRHMVFILLWPGGFCNLLGCIQNRWMPALPHSLYRCVPQELRMTGPTLHAPCLCLSVRFFQSTASQVDPIHSPFKE